MRDEFIQSHRVGQEVDEVVEQLDAFDLALGQYLARDSTSLGMSSMSCARSPQWYRARIAQWCRDPYVCAAFGAEAVLSTALAVPHLSDDEILLFVYDLTDRASAAPDLFATGESALVVPHYRALYRPGR